MNPPKPSATPTLDLLVAEEPDLVDRIFDYILADPVLALALQKIEQRSEADGGLRKIKAAVREEFAGTACYIQGRPREVVTAQVLALFNGRNASEVARRLQISRATVYRAIKQPGRTAK